MTFHFKLNKNLNKKLPVPPSKPMFLEFRPKKPNHNSLRGLFKCNGCGKEFETAIYDVNRGATKSCGCYRLKVSKIKPIKHGHTLDYMSSSTYNTWQGMLTRCNNPNAINYKDYGGRGITVCKRWHNFENFLEDMGEKPKGTSIERKNSNQDYTKNNCKWATRKEQNNNKRTNKIVIYNGIKMSLAQAVEQSNCGLYYDTVQARLKRGLSLTNALFTPV